MTSIDFQPEKKTIEDLFVGADYYVIPRFQRPYSWEASNLDDFWRDVVYDNDQGYFIGPMVVWRDVDSPIRRVVDGQQRLTTIAITFAAIRDQLLLLKEAKLADGIHRYLEKADRNNELKFTLQTETPSRYLGNAVFRNPPDPSVLPQTEEEKALQSAADAVRKKLADEVDRRQRPLKWLLELRDRLLNLRVIWVEHSKEDDAYVIFETLNSRGKDLEVVDLLKNHLLNRLRSSGNASSDSARTKWDQMRHALESDGTQSRIDPNRFILHWWLSQYEYVGERKLFPAVRKTIKTKPQANASLTSLLSDARLYRNALEPNSRTWPTEILAASRSLEALQVFGVSQPTPLLLSLLRAREDSPKLAAKQLIRTLQTVERFHFQHTVVAQLRSSGGVSEMYAKAARGLHSAGNDPQKRSDALDEIRAKLNDRKPDREQFVLGFQERFVFTNEFTRDSKLVRYVLTCLLRHKSPTTATDDLTIEHILPQAAISTGLSDSVVGNIGNLLLVSHAVNKMLDNKTFRAKRSILAAAGLPYDIGFVLDRTEWTEVEIANRAAELAGLSYDEVWKLPC